MTLVDERGDYEVRVMDRGGIVPIHTLRGITRLKYGRLRDDISEAEVLINPGQNLDELENIIRGAGRWELAIWRNRERVWEGPINLVSLGEIVTIHAYDVGFYMKRTVMHARYSNAYPKIGLVVDRAEKIIKTELARKEALPPAINVVPHVVKHTATDPARTSAVTLPYSNLVYNHIDALAQRSGLDYTVLGRAIHLWDVRDAAMGQSPKISPSDFLGKLRVVAYAAETATRTVVTDENGNYGISNGGSNKNGTDAFYGEIELLSQAYDEEASREPTKAELTSQARRNRAGRLPTPITMKIPENSTVNPRGLLTFDHLVPGILVPFEAELHGIYFSQTQKLQSVNIEVNPSGETVQVSLVPSTINDDTGEEG